MVIAKDTSLISRQNSAWIKGLLTLLIILGHDMVFTLPLDNYGVMSFFYTFHIQGFFILPFLYGISKKKYLLHDLQKTIIRLYWPYFLLVSVSMLLLWIYGNFGAISCKDIMRLYFSCDAQIIKQLCGVQLFWFLPSMMCMVLLKEMYYRNGKWVRGLLLTCSFLCILFNVVSAGGQSETAQTWRYISHVFPFGSCYAIGMLIHGVVLRAIIHWVSKQNRYNYAFWLGLSMFLINIVLYYYYVSCRIGRGDGLQMFTVLQNIEPVFFIVLLVSLQKFSMCGSCIVKIGEQSMYVYIISPYVGYACAFACKWLGVFNWWVGLLVVWPTIVVISYLLSILLVRGKVKKFVFPQI